MQVRGYVYDSAGHKIANADVTVTMYNDTTKLSVVKTGTSSSSPLGYFSVDFAVGEWATGETITVVAQYQGGSQGVNGTATADGSNMYQQEDVHLTYEIPQFGNTTGLLVTAGLVGIVAAVALVWIRKAK